MAHRPSGDFMDMKKIILIFVIIVVVLISMINFFNIRTKQDKEINITLQQGFAISVFAENLGKSDVVYPGPNTGPRMLAFRDDVLYASIPSQGKIVALPDRNNDGKADEVVTVLSGLQQPHSFDFHEDWIYVAEENAVSRFRMQGISADSNSMEFLFDLPSGGHWTRTLKVHDNFLYVSIGSSCNVCHEDDEQRAAILKCTLNGNCTIFAKGLRNAVGFIFYEGKIYATDNGRDMLGDDLPPEEINIVEEGKDYGWPICYGNKVHDTEFDKNVYVRDPCEDTMPPLIEMQAHSAPLGLAFYKDDLLVAFHGSWNRREPTGYKVVRINLASKSVEDFASGWLSDGKVSGRPVDVIVHNNIIYVSDDNSGRVYRIYKV